MMNHKVLFLMLIAALLDVVAMADELTTGEYAFTIDGKPACLGQATMDHLFVRGTYNSSSFDNVVAFDEGPTKLVWLWLDDDEIYQNQKVQALTPTPYDEYGNLYNEITYNSFQCKIYLPTSVSIVKGVADNGTRVSFVEGDRLPYTATVAYMENELIVVDGINYRSYTLICSNSSSYCNHLSAIDEELYRTKGALKKDDAPVLGLYLQCNTLNETAQLPDMIIAHQEFGFGEAFTNQPEWEPNDYRFVFCTGGNNQSQRFEYYNRVHLYGNGNSLISETPKITYQIHDRSAVITATGKGQVELKVNGEAVDNPCRIDRTDQDLTIIATAVAREEGKAVSDVATANITIPAIEIKNFFSIPDSTVMRGKELDIPVSMINADNIVAFQTDISLPDGFMIKPGDSQDYMITPCDRITAGHVLMTSDLPSGDVRLLCYSPGVNLIDGHNGELFHFTIIAPDDAQGDYTITLKNTLLTTDELEELHIIDTEASVNVMTYLPGDANGNGEVTVTDAVTTAWEALMLHPQPFVFEAADMNHDGLITVTDVTWIAYIILHPDAVTRLNAKSTLATNDKFSSKGVHVRQGETAQATIDLKSENDYAAFQFDMILPQNVTVSNFALTTRSGRLALQTNTLPDGTIRVLGYSPQLDVIRAGEGAVLSFDVTATGEVMMDSIIVNGIELTTPACENVEFNSFGLGVNMPVSNTVDEMMENGQTVVTARGRDIIVDAPVAQTIIIADVMGRTTVVRVDAGRTSIPVDNAGVYLIRTGQMVTKLMLK